MSMTPFIGFRPDLDPTTPGIFTDCDDLIPTVRGFKAMPSSAATLLPALAAAAVGAALVMKLDATTRLFVGTAVRIYEAGASSWTDRSKGGVDYTTGTFWRFAQFGNDTIAANKSDILQTSSSAAFADITNAPKASYIDAAAGFVMVGATNEATYGDQSDRWWCSAYQDATSASAWVPSVTTQCTTGRLIDAPGPITGIKALGSDFVAYKQKSMFLGRYVGAPSVFTWLQVPGNIGCAGQEAVVNIGTSHIFVGLDNVYQYDGSRPVPIGDDINEWFFNRINKSYRHLITGMHERTANRVWFFYPAGLSTTLTEAIVYNYVSQKWAKVSLALEVPVEYLSGAITYHGLGTLYSTFNDLPDIPFDSPFWLTGTELPAIIDAAHTLQTITGVSDGCSITTGDTGDDTQRSLVTRVRPRFIQSPTSGTITNYYKDDAGAALTLDATSSLNSGKFDVLRSANWHRFKYDFVGDCEIIGDVVSLAPDGFS